MNSDAEPPKENKNLARNIRLAFPKLSREVANARPRSLEDALALRDWLRDKIWGNDLTADERQERLFTFNPKDPRPWDKLEMAVLDSRCLPLPESKLPTTQDELLELCTNLLDRTDDFHMLAHFVEGWGDELPAGALKAFCDQLWHTKVNDYDFYRAVVLGMHGAAVAYLSKQIPRGHTAESAIRLIYRMALIWCAHDVQTTAARARRSMTKPLGWLLAGTGKRIRAGTVLAICRPVYNMLVVNTGRYRTNEEIRGGKKEALHSRHEDVKTIKAKVEPLLINRSARSVSTRRERDGLLTAIRGFAEAQDDLFWTELRKEKTSPEIAHLQISQLWYSGLTPLQMIAVSVIRLIQIEAVLESRIAGMHKCPMDGETISPPLLYFRKEELPDNWRKRALLLIGDLRRVILDDPDHETRRDEDDLPGHINDDFLEAALKFFEEVASEPLPNDPSTLKGARRTLATLNVCAAVRLAR